MRGIIIATALFVAFVAAEFHNSDETLFRKFIVQHKKVYQSADEFNAKFANFKDNLRRIEQLNAMEGQEASFGINKFADMSQEEFSAAYLMPKFDPAQDCIWPYHRIATVPEEKTRAIPASFDWRKSGVVTPVKNQEQCGSCWTFSTTGNIEGQWKLNGPKKQLVGLSEQFIVDCSTACLASDPQLCNGGCDGGLPWLAYEDIIKNNGLPAEAAYPYTGEDGTCSNANPLVAKISNWTALSTDPTQVITYLYSNGPLSITLNADLLMSYDTGIITGTPDDCPNSGSDHAVLLVGYGKNATSGTPYWLVKNSWGTDWGMEGYFMMESDNGLCGINACVTSSIVNFH